MKSRPIYLDYMATTPIDDRVLESMLPYLRQTGEFGNPASKTHPYGEAAACAVEHARMQIASTVGTSPEALVFTSGATESDNLAIIGAARFYQRKGRHLITMTTEHKAVLDSFAYLEKNGFEVTYLTPTQNGLLDLEQLENAIRPDTILVSVMQVNNEIGVIQDIASIGESLKGRGIIFHVDAAQSVGPLKLNLDALCVDLMSFSAHKVYGPKGIGALYISQKPRIRIAPQSFGGDHESGLRAGTLPTHQIVGMGAAFELADTLRAEEQARILKLRTCFLEAISGLSHVSVNGCLENRIAGNINLCFKGIDNTELLMRFHTLALSTASACASSRDPGSHVLRALGLSVADAQSSLRLSLGRFTTEADIEHLIACVLKKANLT